jgi:hypothetical protein
MYSDPCSCALYCLNHNYCDYAYRYEMLAPAEMVTFPCHDKNCILWVKGIVTKNVWNPSEIIVCVGPQVYRETFRELYILGGGIRHIHLRRPII